MKRKLFAVLLTSVGALGLTVATITFTSKVENSVQRSVGTEYTLTLDANNAPDGMSSMAGLFTNKVFKTGDNNEIKLNYRIAKTVSGYHVVLGNRGEIYNSTDSSEYGNKITGISSITANFTTEEGGALYLQTSLKNEGGLLNDPVALTSGSEVTLAHNPNYFSLTAGDKYVYITSIVIKYSCSEANQYQEEHLKGSYTGLGDDGYIYQLDLNGANASIKSLDRQSNIQINNGTASYNADEVTLSFATYDVTYKFNVSSDLSKFTFASKSGAGASMFPTLDLYRVYDVENFNGYTSTGQGRDNSHDYFQTSGMRSSFYSTYFGGSDESKQVLMGSSDYLTLKTDIKHGSSGNSASIKTNSNYMRFVQNRVYYGNPHSVGKGRYLSFWARHGYNGSNVQSKTIDVDVYAFKYDHTFRLNSNDLLSNSNYRTVGQVTLTASTGWHQYMIEIDDSIEYKGFGIRAHSNDSNTFYVPIDDFQIFTHNPWAEYVEPQSISVDRNVGTINVGGNLPLNVSIEPSGASQAITYTSSNTNIATVDNNGVITGVGAGTATITAKSSVNNSLSKTVSVKVVSATYLGNTFKGTITAASTTHHLLIALGERGEYAVLLNNKLDIIKANGYSYDPSTKRITITSTGSYSSLTFGTITATYDESNNRLINFGCGGTIGQYVANNGSITINAIGKVASEGAIFHCNENTAGLRALFSHRDKSSGTAKFTDIVEQNIYDSITGNGAVKHQFSANNANGICLKNSIGGNTTFGSFGCWVFNPTDINVTLTLYVFKDADMSSSANPASFTAVAGQWTWVCSGIGCSSFKVGTDKLYNVLLNAETTAALTFDEVCLYIS